MTWLLVVSLERQPWKTCDWTGAPKAWASIAHVKSPTSITLFIVNHFSLLGCEEHLNVMIASHWDSDISLCSDDNPYLSNTKELVKKFKKRRPHIDASREWLCSSNAFTWFFFIIEESMACSANKNINHHTRHITHLNSPPEMVRLTQQKEAR